MCKQKAVRIVYETGSKCFEASWKGVINELLMQLFKGRVREPLAYLEVPEEFQHCKGVYVSVNPNKEFWIREGNCGSKTVEYFANDSIWVPSSFLTSMPAIGETNEEFTMDLVSLVMAEELYAVTVKFNGSSSSYTYKSQTEIAEGTKVVVDSPTNGFVVVTVVACSKGLDTNVDKFSTYKWVVTIVDTTEYNRLRDVEVQMVAKAKAKARLDAAKAQLEALGFTQEELIAMVKGV